jgi:hydroxyacylglutathione hydrolase
MKDFGGTVTFKEKTMLLYQRFVPGLAIASYVAGDERTGDAAVVDPTRDVDDFVRYATNNDLHIKHILETYGRLLAQSPIC